MLLFDPVPVRGGANSPIREMLNVGGPAALADCGATSPKAGTPAAAAVAIFAARFMARRPLSRFGMLRELYQLFTRLFEIRERHLSALFDSFSNCLTLTPAPRPIYLQR